MRKPSSSFILSRKVLCCILLGLALSAAGCSTSGTVSGKVTYEGKTVGGGNVIFHIEGKPAVTAPIDESGNYTATKVPTGTVKVAVETDSARPTKDPPKSAGKMAPPEMPKDVSGGIYGAQKGPKGKYVEIPPQYADPAKSGLTFDVHGGAQTFNIDLKKEK